MTCVDVITYDLLSSHFSSLADLQIYTAIYANTAFLKRHDMTLSGTLQIIKQGVLCICVCNELRRGKDLLLNYTDL